MATQQHILFLHTSIRTNENDQSTRIARWMYWNVLERDWEMQCIEMSKGVDLPCWVSCPQYTQVQGYPRVLRASSWRTVNYSRHEKDENARRMHLEEIHGGRGEGEGSRPALVGSTFFTSGFTCCNECGEVRSFSRHFSLFSRRMSRHAGRRQRRTQFVYCLLCIAVCFQAVTRVEHVSTLHVCSCLARLLAATLELHTHAHWTRLAPPKHYSVRMI